jgi:hypothetical protein
MATRKGNGRRRTRRTFDPGRTPAPVASARAAGLRPTDDAGDALARLQEALSVLEKALAELERRR